MNVSFYFLPYVVSRYYLWKDIQHIALKFPFRGTILDIGCGEKPYENLFKDAKKYIGIDFKNYSKTNGFISGKPDIYFDDEYKKSSCLSIPSKSFDHIVCFQVLEHHPEPQKLVKEILRVLKPDGYLLLSAPFMWGLHEVPNDYYRFTEFGLKRLLMTKNTKVVNLKKQGSIFSLLITLLTDYLIEIANRNKFTYALAILFYPILLLGSYISFILDDIFPSRKLFLNYLVLVQKKQ